MMKVSGNAAASDFFARNGGNHLLSPGTEGKVKYTSQAAVAYKEELKKRILQDAHPGQISDPVIFPGLSNLSGTGGLTDDAVAPKEDDVDFFDEWDEPKPKPAASKAVAAKGGFSVQQLTLAGASRLTLLPFCTERRCLKTSAI